MTGSSLGSYIAALSTSPAPLVTTDLPSIHQSKERRQSVRWSWGGCDTIVEDQEATETLPVLRVGSKPSSKRRRHRACRSWEGYHALEEEEPDVMKGRWIDSMPGLKALVQRRSSAAPPAPGPSATPTRPLLAADRQLSTPSMFTLLRLDALNGYPKQELKHSRLSLQSETSYSLPEASNNQQVMVPLLHSDISEYSEQIIDAPLRLDMTLPASRNAGGSRGVRGPLGASCSSLTAQVQLHENPGIFRSASSSRALLTEPLRPVNRLRSSGGSLSRVCSRCSSLLSLASSSRYSLNAAGSFEPIPPVLCKLCLGEVPVKDTSSIAHCGCTFCRDCMKCYVQFEIQEGAYDISCPDAQCARQGVVSLTEVQVLVGDSFMEKYKRYRLNREVDMDVSRLWCPKAGCETVVHICPTGERCLPQNVHCPTCASDFCSNCKHPWHGGITCEENTRLTQQLTKEPGIPFDNDLIKCCPMCNVPIEKDEGCAQMMCKRCKHVFCWYCLASLDDDFLLRHYDKGPCKNKLGHSRASVIWHRTQVIGIFAGFGILLLVASPLLLLAAPCIVCCKCRVCSGGGKLDSEEEST